MLDTSGHPVFVVGNRRGGLQLIRKSYAAPDTTTDLVDEPFALPAPKVFPNPTEGRFEIDFGNNTGPGYQLHLRNPLGQTILVEETRALRREVDLTLYPKGVYFLQIRQASQTWVYKIVVQ